ncbi:MAG: hypothetical protein ACRCTA_07280 [Bacilli bacterium]
MLTISSALKQNDLIAMFDNQTIDGVTFKYVDKSGINLRFTYEGEHEDIISLVKQKIKESTFGAALFFRVTI